MQMESRYCTVNGVTLHVKVAGEASGQAIVFLHGFPSFWYSWQRQTDYFAARGFYVIVPDGRGYNLSDKPRNVSDYRLPLLVQDVVQLLAALQVQQPVVVAHDWGGIVAWALLKTHPALVKKAVIINAPYLPAYTTFRLAQLRKSWYVYFFQLPRLPEWMMKRKKFSFLKRLLVKTSVRGTFSPEDLMMYEEAWAQKGSLTAMVNWYRALARYAKDAKEIFSAKVPVETPVLVLWGMKDAFLEPDSGVCKATHCSHFSMIEYADATHWLPQEKNGEVNEEVEKFVVG